MGEKWPKTMYLAIKCNKSKNSYFQKIILVIKTCFLKIRDFFFTENLIFKRLKIKFFSWNLLSKHSVFALYNCNFQMTIPWMIGYCLWAIFCEKFPLKSSFPDQEKQANSSFSWFWKDPLTKKVSVSSVVCSKQL